MAIIATLLGCQGIDEFKTELPRALDGGLTPVMVKEVVYQAVDYLGIGRVRPFLDAVNEILTERGVNCLWKDRLQLLWKTVWRKGHRPRWIFLARA